MLIDKGVSSGEVVTLKLMSGEEMVAKYVEETTNGHKLSKPMLLSMGQQGIGMVPFAVTVDMEKDITIGQSAVVAIEPTEKQFADAYVQNTTGIKLAS
jgi:hypothetical protein